MSVQVAPLVLTGTRETAEQTRGALIMTTRTDTAPRLRYRLIQDESPPDPRTEWDHFATMVCSAHCYELGDRKSEDQELEAYRRGGLPLLTRYLRRYEGAVDVQMLGLLDHSGLHMYLEGGPHWTDSAGWDSGTVGFIYCTQKQLDAAGISPDHTHEQMARKIIEQEVEEYDQYLTGDVYGYVIDEVPDCDDDECEDRGQVHDDSGSHLGYGSRNGCYCACHDEGEQIDSCWGFYGHEYAEQEAKDALKSCQEHALANAELDAARPWLGGVTC